LPTVAYCLNVFPGGTREELRSTLEGPVSRLRRLVDPAGTLALELHVGTSLAKELLSRKTFLADLRSLLRDLGLAVVSVNAFPIGDFHQERVKSDVFCPPWPDPERVETTIRAGKILAGLLDGGGGAVSTSPGTYRGFGVEEFTRTSIARAMARVARDFAALEKSTGKCIVLAVEPEPWGMMETVEEAAKFIELLHAVGAGVVRGGGEGAKDAERTLRRHVGVNPDLCHQSVLFEDFDASFRLLKERGIAVPKVHVSSAVAVERPSRAKEAMERLCRLGDDPWLHQVTGIHEDGGIRRVAADLDRIRGREDEAFEGLVQLRAHLHVPVFLSDAGGGIATTAAETARAVEVLLRSRVTELLVVETYTWPGLDGRLPVMERGDLVDGMARELLWLADLVETHRLA